MKMKQKDLLKLTAKFLSQKELIQKAFDDGVYITITDFAHKNELPYTRAKNILDAIGIEIPQRSRQEAKNIHAKNILIVLERICKELHINYDEIKPYL